MIVDAAAGVVTTEPTAEELERAQNRAAARASAASAPITDGALADGTPVPLLANLGKPDGAVDAVALGAEGVGLFRTEFLFLSSTQAPTVEQQRESYTKLLVGVPRQEGRRARARRRRRQAAAVPQRRARGEPGARACAASAPCGRARTSCASS